MIKSLVNNLVCKHRHHIETHPACFAEGNVNLDQAKALEDRYGKPWYLIDGYKIGIIDIEADGLKADFNTMLSWCIKEKDGAVVTDVVSKEELFNGTADRRIVQTCVDEMSKYKILIGYYSTGYDIPFLRAKALHYNILFPGYNTEAYTQSNGNEAVRILADIYHFDMYYVVKSKLCISRKSLDASCDFLGIKGKTPLDREVWRLAKYGDPTALASVLEHNIADCVILEKLHQRLSPFVKFTKKSI